MMAHGKGLTQKNMLKNSLSIATLNNLRTQVTRPLDILHWVKSWDTQVTHIWPRISTMAHWNIDP
jgi:hypothetical protein